MAEKVMKMRLFFYELLELLHSTLGKIKNIKSCTLILIFVNGISMFLTFQGTKKDNTSSAILSTMALLSIAVYIVDVTGLDKNEIMQKDLYLLLGISLTVMLLLISIIFLIGRNARFSLLSVLFSFKFYDFFLPVVKNGVEEMFYIVVVNSYLSVVFYLLLYFLPRFMWSVIYSTVGSMFFCYTIERIFEMDCGIIYLLEKNNDVKSTNSTAEGLTVLYFTSILGVLYQMYSEKNKR